MLPRIKLSWLLALLLGLTLFSCTKKEKAEGRLSRPWAFSGPADELFTKGDTLKLTSNNDDQKFIFTGSEDKRVVTGDWVLKGDTIFFTQDPENSETAVDSIAVKTADKKTQFLFFNNGTQIASSGEANINVPRNKDYFLLKKVDETNLQIRAGDKDYNFSYKAKEVEGNLNFNSILRGMLGMISLVFILYLLSSHKRAIPWKLVISGLAFQILFAIAVLKIPFVQSVFESISGLFVVVLDFTKAGSEFIFGGLLNTKSYGFIFALQILPTIIFFSALMSLFFYLGILQKIVYGLAWVMGKTMKISGAENLSTAANIFLGQTEAPLMIRHYLPTMTRSEMLCIMVGGMANTAGGVLAAYVGFLGGDDPAQQLFFAKHLLAASVMSAPATIVVSKMLLPQTEEIVEKIEVSKEKIGTNMLEAIANGTTDGLRLAVNVAAMLIVFTALMAMINYILEDQIGDKTGLNGWIANVTGRKDAGFSLDVILGYLCAPITWLLGVNADDMVRIGQLLGEKTILNEFYAYGSMAEMKAGNEIVHQKSIVMGTYILSGFANFASIGIQIGGIGSLAPNKRSMISQLGIKALIGGTIASLFTATIVGMLM